MTIYDQDKKPIAVTTTVVTGVPFVHGITLDFDSISLRGFSLAIVADDFVRAMRDGETYLVENASPTHWRLHRVVLRGPQGIVVHPETLLFAKEESGS